MPDLRITALVAAYNEADIIGQTVGDLVRQGIHVHVLDNLSTDGTVAALQPYVSSGLVRVERFPDGQTAGSGTRYEHGRIMLRKQQLARELDSDWFIAHDADEIRESPWVHLDLRQGIEQVDREGWNAIDFAVLNFCPTDDRFSPGADVREVFPYYEPAGPWDRTQVKCWKRAPDVELVASAGHDVQFASRHVFPIRFILRHYPIRSQAHGVRKIFEERKPRFPDEERRQGWHVQYDGIAPDHQFVRDPATLTRFLPEQARLDVLMQDLSAIQARLEQQPQQARDVRSQHDLEASRSRLQQHQIEIESQLQRIDSQARDLERLSSLVNERDRTVAQLQAAIGRLERDRADLRASLSWKVTAPLRGLWRLFQKP